MDDLTDRLARLNATVQKGIEERKAQRAEQWHRIKTESPDMAEFLTTVRQVFPDSKVVELELKGDRIV